MLIIKYNVLYLRWSTHYHHMLRINVASYGNFIKVHSVNLSTGEDVCCLSKKGSLDGR